MSQTMTKRQLRDQRRAARQAAEKLLSNPVIEDVVSVHPAEPQA